jgi:hypothetical protein
MWQKPEEVKTRDIEKVESCHFVGKDKAQNIINALSVEIINLNEKKTSPTKSDFEFLDRIQDIQKNEWDKWQINGQDVAGMRVAYKEEEKPAQDEKQSPARIFLHSVNNVRYFVTFNKSPYYKKIKESYSNTLAHELENSAYHYALQSLQLTEEALKRDLHNQSYFQRLWNYRKRQNTHETLALIKNEIALFKNQDAIDEAKDGKPYLKKEEYLKPSLTHRQVFTRSSMPRTFFEKVKTARE